MADVPQDGVPVDGVSYNVVVGDMSVTSGADDHYHVLQCMFYYDLFCYFFILV